MERKYPSFFFSWLLTYQGVDFVSFRHRSHSCHRGLQSDRMGDLLARSDRCSPSPRHDFVDFVFPIQGRMLNIWDELMSFWWKLLRLCIEWHSMISCAELKKMPGKVQSLLEELECEKSFYNEATWGDRHWGIMVAYLQETEATL